MQIINSRLLIVATYWIIATIDGFLGSLAVEQDSIIYMSMFYLFSFAIVALTFRILSKNSDLHQNKLLPLTVGVKVYAISMSFMQVVFCVLLYIVVALGDNIGNSITAQILLLTAILISVLSLAYAAMTLPSRV